MAGDYFRILGFGKKEQEAEKTEPQQMQDEEDLTVKVVCESNNCRFNSGGRTCRLKSIRIEEGICTDYEQREVIDEE